MRWTEVKTSELEATNYGGLQLAFEVDGTRIRAVTIESPTGGKVKMQRGDYGGLEVFTPAPPPTKKVHRLSGEVCGLQIQEDFESYSDAEDRKAQLESNLTEDSTLVVEKMEVPVVPSADMES